jgi:hypothetical protein
MKERTMSNLTNVGRGLSMNCNRLLILQAVREGNQIIDRVFGAQGILVGPQFILFPGIRSSGNEILGNLVWLCRLALDHRWVKDSRIVQRIQRQWSSGSRRHSRKGVTILAVGIFRQFEIAKHLLALPSLLVVLRYWPVVTGYPRRYSKAVRRLNFDSPPCKISEAHEIKILPRTEAQACLGVFNWTGAWFLSHIFPQRDAKSGQLSQ